MKQILILIAVLMMALAAPRSVFARYVDFSLNAPSGQRLDYQIVGNNVAVFIQDDQYRLSITGSLIIPPSVTYAGITYSVTMIGGSAFEDCSGLTSVTIPNTVTSIYQRAFSGCSGLTSITVESGSSVFDCRDNCNAIIETSTNKLIVGCMNTVIPNSVTSIGDYAFSGCSGLTSVIIPNNVTSIDEYAFNGCTGLASLTIPASVTSIATYAFANCTGLTDLVFNAEVGMYGLYSSNPFYADTNIINLTLGCSVIPERFCSYMNHLQTITIDSTVTQISASAISSHSETHYNGTIEQWLAIDMVNDYSNPLIYSNKLYLGDTLTTHLYIPEGVTVINNNFRNDTALTHIYIPSTVISISSYAFNGCAPSWFYFKPATPPTLASWQAFTYTTSGGQTYGSLMMVPWQSLQAYKTAPNYTTFAQNLIYPDSCMLLVNINNTALGTVTLDGGSTLSHLYQLLDTATISVSLLDADNYSYNIVADGCTIIDTSNTNTYMVRLNRNDAYPTVQVNFIGETHHVNAVANDTEYGTVTGTNDYAYGANVTVEATPTDGYYFVRWSDGSTDNPATFICTSDTTVMAIFSPVVTPELCMVSVQNDRNVLLWDTEDKPIVSYTVYREGTVSGEYEAIATIPYAEAGEWTDNDSRPSSRSYRYRLTATDTCGNESETSGIHKTMHLTISQGVGTTWNLVWTPYEGAEYTTYVIYRGTSAADIAQIDIMPSAGNTTYTDNNASSGSVYYQVGVMMTTPCGSAKAATISRSNIASSEGGTQGIDDVAHDNICIYTHNGRIMVDGAEGETLCVFSVLGKLVANESLSAGVYMVKVGDYPVRKVVVIRYPPKRHKTIEGAAASWLLLSHDVKV